MENVVINGENYDSFASLAEADSYLNASTYYATWSTFSDDDKGRFLVSATNYLISLSWQSTCLPLEDQENIKTATILIAANIAGGNTAFLGLVPAEQDVKQYKAGSVSITYQTKPYFINLTNPYALMPSQILNLLKPCLSSFSTGSIGATSFGTDGAAGDSVWNGDYDFSRL